MKTVSWLLAGVDAALVALLAEQHLTWRSGAVAALAGLGALGIPAIHSSGQSEGAAAKAAADAPPYEIPTVAGAVQTPSTPAAAPAAQTLP
jgi:hypothetical protein